jgi:hypothetical protein
LQGYPWNFSNPFNQALGSSGKKGRNIAGQILAREAMGGGEGLAHEHQELKACPGGLGRKRGWPEVGFPRRPRRRRGGARRRGASRRGRRPSSGLLAAAGGEGATGVAGLNREGAEGGVRRQQELTGEEGNDGDRAPMKDWRRGGIVVWQNHLNYSGSSVLIILTQPILTQRTSNGTIHWSVGSPPDTTTVQQDRSRFTSHEGEFTITAQLINF